MKTKNNLSDRMKKYEGIYKSSIMPKTPAIIRLDGKAFHTWTRGLNKPFDNKFYAAMSETAQQLVDNIQGAVFAYGQSDEISILLKDYSTISTDAWFDGEIQKIVSVSASMATAYFNEAAKQMKISKKSPALFDSRVFTLPPHEVANYFIWRQQDFKRNSIQMCARYYLGHKKCMGLKQQDMIDEMRAMDKPFDWYKDLIDVYRRGYTYDNRSKSILYHVPEFVEMKDFIEVHVIN